MRLESVCCRSMQVISCSLQVVSGRFLLVSGRFGECVLFCSHGHGYLRQAPHFVGNRALHREFDSYFSRLFAIIEKKKIWGGETGLQALVLWNFGTSLMCRNSLGFKVLICCTNCEASRVPYAMFITNNHAPFHLLGKNC